MQQSNQEPYPYQTDEIDLRKLFNSLVVRKLFIFGLTGFVTLLAIIYALNLTPTYKAISSFISPSDSSIININKLELTSESKESVFTNYLTFLSSQETQRKVFLDGGYLTALNPENEPIDNVEEYAASFLSSIEVEQRDTMISGNLIESPYSISMTGGNAKVISRFLNELVVMANHENISAINGLINQKIGIRLDEISIERGLLLDQTQLDRLSQIERIKEEDAQKIREINDQIDALRLKTQLDRLSQIERIKEEDAQKIREINDQIDALRLKTQLDRLSQIERIKEEDAQKIREINDQIDRARYKTKEDRLNQIVVLTDDAKLAGSLGIIENNLEKIIKSVESDFNLNIAINEDKDLPEWYLYGEKALQERVELLESRTSDDPFIPELVTLNNQLKEIQNNNLLKTLEARQNDDPFIAELVTLNNQLKEIQNNNLLKTLEARQNDDPFIAELVTLNNQLKVIQNNNLLKTLEARQNDSPFIAEIVKLDIEQIKLDSAIVDMTGINSMQLSRSASTKSIEPNKRMIVLLALIGSFMMSIFLALVMGALKPDEEHST